ncbi:hypothetical protein B0H17DRAFT_1135537 [Mycena rosella]|uniref:Uncharacterized protein n=1 Tax=Mycena rosella TaxID=1033263 RepID=A0AAD7GCU1_MYCRO|nr:hypothetical protein B0H17DRAFT_1135537 [Mycena rosella]
MSMSAPSRASATDDLSPAKDHRVRRGSSGYSLMRWRREGRGASTRPQWAKSHCGAALVRGGRVCAVGRAAQRRGGCACSTRGTVYHLRHAGCRRSWERESSPLGSREARVGGVGGAAHLRVPVLELVKLGYCDPGRLFDRGGWHLTGRDAASQITCAFRDRVARSSCLYGYATRDTYPGPEPEPGTRWSTGLGLCGALSVALACVRMLPKKSPVVARQFPCRWVVSSQLAGLGLTTPQRAPPPACPPAPVLAPTLSANSVDAMFVGAFRLRVHECIGLTGLSLAMFSLRAERRSVSFEGPHTSRRPRTPSIIRRTASAASASVFSSRMEFLVRLMHMLFPAALSVVGRAARQAFQLRSFINRDFGLLPSPGHGALRERRGSFRLFHVLFGDYAKRNATVAEPLSSYSFFRTLNNLPRSYELLQAPTSSYAVSTGSYDSSMRLYALYEPLLRFPGVLQQLYEHLLQFYGLLRAPTSFYAVTLTLLRAATSCYAAATTCYVVAMRLLHESYAAATRVRRRCYAGALECSRDRDLGYNAMSATGSYTPERAQGLLMKSGQQNWQCSGHVRRRSPSLTGVHGISDLPVNPQFMENSPAVMQYGSGECALGRVEKPQGLRLGLPKALKLQGLKPSGEHCNAVIVHTSNGLDFKTVGKVLGGLIRFTRPDGPLSLPSGGWLKAGEKKLFGAAWSRHIGHIDPANSRLLIFHQWQLPRGLPHHAQAIEVLKGAGEERERCVGAGNNEGTVLMVVMRCIKMMDLD